jgi:hypothetical protein
MLPLRRYMSFRTTSRQVLFICYILGVMLITLVPSPALPERRLDLHLQPFEDIGRLRYGRGKLNVIGNVLLFLPLSMFLPGRSFVRVLLLGGLGSVSIELCQLGLSLFADANRTISLDDVILNTSGAVLGYAVATMLSVRRGPAGTAHARPVCEDQNMKKRVGLPHVPGRAAKGICPCCSGHLYRLPRRPVDRLLTLLIPVRRYGCTECSWQGLAWRSQ